MCQKNAAKTRQIKMKLIFINGEQLPRVISQQFRLTLIFAIVSIQFYHSDDCWSLALSLRLNQRR